MVFSFICHYIGIIILLNFIYVVFLVSSFCKQFCESFERGAFVTQFIINLFFFLQSVNSNSIMHCNDSRTKIMHCNDSRTEINGSCEVDCTLGERDWDLLDIEPKDLVCYESPNSSTTVGCGNGPIRVFPREPVPNARQKGRCRVGE